MPKLLNCLYCGTVTNNSYKGERHTLKHLPWFFASNLCVVCERKYNSTPKLLEHCESDKHTEAVKLNKNNVDISQLRKDFITSEVEKKGEEFGKFLEPFIVKKFLTNYDRPDGILDHINLFPNSLAKVMNTPELDSDVLSTSAFNGTLPLEFPRMPCQPPQVSSVDSGCSTQGSVDSGSASAVEDLCASVASTPSRKRGSSEFLALEDLPEPPAKITKRARCPSEGVHLPAEDKLSLVLAKLQTLESKVEGLGKKVVDTAESQAADIKGKLARLGELIEGNTTSIQDYSKSLAVVLQKDLAKLFDTIQLMRDSPRAPPMSQAMMSALLTISQETVKVYETPYQPQN